MKVLFINETDVRGGAAKAAYRLHTGMIAQGVDSKMIVRRKYSNDPTVTTSYSSDFGNIIDQVKSGLTSKFQRLQNSNNKVAHSTSLFPSGLHRFLNKSDADIIHLHWVSGKLMTIREISKIKKPIVWTLHDMWAFSGSEHYDDLEAPGRYKVGYLKSNRPENHEGLDIDRWTWNKKMKYWRDKKFHIVTPSHWMAECADESILFKDRDIQVIPNGIDVDVFKPIPKDQAREILNIPNPPRNTCYLLFGALSPTQDKRKGYKQLLKCLSHLKTNQKQDIDFRLIVFGSKENKQIDFGLPTIYLGYLTDDQILALAYSAADVMLVPSLQDNLPNTAVEAMACGAPVVAYNIGGMSDIIDHRVNGYLASPFDVHDLAEGIQWTVEQLTKDKKLAVEARNKALTKFKLENNVERYIDLYSESYSEK